MTFIHESNAFFVTMSKLLRVVYALMKDIPGLLQSSGKFGPKEVWEHVKPLTQQQKLYGNSNMQIYFQILLYCIYFQMMISGVGNMLNGKIRTFLTSCEIFKNFLYFCVVLSQSSTLCN